MKFARELSIYVFSNYASSEIIYLLYPFLRILKILGFMPIQFQKRVTGKLKIIWDWRAILWTLVLVFGLTVGFCISVYNLQQAEHWSKVREASVIAYFTNWVQIFALFGLSMSTLTTSWTSLHAKQELFNDICQIDYRLQSLTNEFADYKKMRCCMLIKFIGALFVPLTLSMVNCIVIRARKDTRMLTSGCYWFICFIPILLVTIKEFQFYNLLIVLRSKLERVNAQLRKYAPKFVAAGSDFRSSEGNVDLAHAHIEFPLTAPTAAWKFERENEQSASNEQLECLLVIYSSIADNIDRVLCIFAWHLLLSTTISFAIITIQCYNLFALIMHSIELEPYQVGFVVSWILIQFAVIGINVRVCSMISKTMSATGPLVHKVAVGMKMNIQTVQLFSMEVLHRKNNLSAAGFFNLNPQLITSIIAATTTYLVIIIQFHITNVGGLNKNT